MKSVINDVNEGTIVLAEEQTAGRGRFSRSWISQKYMNLTFSLLLKPNYGAEKFGLLSLLSGIAVVRASKSVTGLTTTCKWPNDVLLDGKKVCGILSELVKDSNGTSCVIVGIGINVNQTEFPEELQTTATSLSLHTHTTIDRLHLLSVLFEELKKGYEQFQSGNYSAIIQDWKKNSTMLGQHISVQQNNSTLTGIATDIADDGALVIRTDSGLMKVYAGDVTISKKGTP
ncbi:MAG: biotin--[acetyl-CoA-carboxylase] ligase [Ignavibacteriae bacterium]|nr:biotin--[acetyl-CoA-carboxylase] ligase [Ignavibacteriota bacterium]